MRSPLPSIRCLDSNSRLALRYKFGSRNKDTMSLGCVALVPPTLLTFIKYSSNTYMDIQVPHMGYAHGCCLTSGGSSYQEMPGTSQWPAFMSTVFLVKRHSCDIMATHYRAGVTLTASN